MNADAGDGRRQRSPDQNCHQQVGYALSVTHNNTATVLPEQQQSWRCGNGELSVRQLDVASRFLLTSSGSLILEPSFGWPARVAFLNPLFSTPRSIFHLSASLDMLPKGV